MVIEKTLNPPPDIALGVEKQAERVSALLENRKLKIGDEKAERIEADVFKKYEDWRVQTTQLRRRLVRWNDLIEGVVKEMNFPFSGSSNITTHYAAGISRTFKAQFNKTMYQDEDIFVPSLDPTLNMSRDEHSALQDGFNHTFSVKYDGLDTLKSMTAPCLRDGTGILSCSWERRVEKATDTRTYDTYGDFLKDYPDAESAGIPEDEYKQIAADFIIEPESRIQVEFEYDFVKFDGIESRINSFAKFVFFPTFAPSVDRMQLYGNLYNLSEQEIRLKTKRREFYDRGAAKIFKDRGTLNQDTWDRAQASIEGISYANEDSEKPVLCGDFVYRKDLDGDGIPEVYLLTFAVDAKALLSIQRYPIRNNVDVCVEFRMLRRDNRFPGVSLIGDCEDLFEQIDILHRHRNNIRMLCTSPVFLAKSTYKEALDLGRAENVFRPGLTLWVDDINNSMKQLELRNLDQPGNELDEESLLSRYIEMVIGVTQGQSGMQTPDDPRAPARKTQMLLMQANQRIDDYMDEFRKSLPRLAKLWAALLYQYYPDSEIVFEKNNQAFRFPKSLLANPKITWVPKRRSVNFAPEFAMGRMQGLMEIYANLLPLLQSGDPMAIEMWNRQVMNSGEPDNQKLLIDEQKAQLLSQQAQQRSESAMTAQSDAKAKQKGKANFHGEVGKGLGRALAEALSGKANGNVDGKLEKTGGLNNGANTPRP